MSGIMWRPVSLVTQFVLIVLLTISFYVVPTGLDGQVIWPIILLFYLYAVRSIARQVYIVPRIPVRISIELGFYAFYFLIFIEPYQAHLLGFSDIGTNRLLYYAYPGNSNLAMVAAGVGFTSFHFGLNLLDRPAQPTCVKRIPNRTQDNYRYIIHLVFVLLTALITLYIALGFQSSDEGRYSNQVSGGVTGDGIYYVIIVLCMLVVAGITAVIANGRVPDPVLWAAGVTVLFWSLRILINGDRNNFFMIAIAAGVGYSTFIRRTSVFVMVAAAIAAMSLYKAVEVTRMGTEKSISAVLEQLLNPDEKDDVDSLATPTATVRAAIDIVPDEMDYGYGWYKFLGFTGFVPYVRGLLLGNLRFGTTADVLTYFMLPPNSNWSVGTTVLSDIYIDFGILGIPVLMIGLGVYVSFIQNYARRQPYSSKHIAVYIVTAATLAELPRYGLDFPVRAVVWTFMIFFVYDVLIGLMPRARRLYSAVRTFHA